MVDVRAPLVQNAEAALEKLNAATQQLERLNPQNALLIRELKERVSREGATDDVLSEVVRFVLAAENVGSIHEAASEAQGVREKARQIREEALNLQRETEAIWQCVRQLQTVYEQRVANTEFMRDLAKKS